MDQKRDNELNLALMLPETERARTTNLNTGYDSIINEWELIIRYSGDFIAAAATIINSIKELSQGYALVKLYENRIDELAALPEVIFMEKPKRLAYELDYSVVAACITPVWSNPYNLTGEGILVGIIDSGIDYTHPDFRNADGTTRIHSIYDETSGAIYSADIINQALQSNDVAMRRQLIPISDVSGHGTHVAGIAAGNGRESEGRYRGVAYRATLVVVRLGEDEFNNTARLMEGIDYVIRTAQELKIPVAINLSIGNNYGAHDGNSLLENYIDEVSGTWKNVIVAGTGNDAANGIHKSGVLGEQTENAEFVIGESEMSLDIQLWKSYSDTFFLWIIAPDGQRLGPISKERTVTKLTYRDTLIYVYYGEPTPYSSAQEIFIQFIPQGNYINSGIWKLQIEPVRIKNGEYDLWLPSSAFISRNTGFTTNSPETTLTIPSTAYNVISTGAYNARLNAYANFSGRGNTRRVETAKPDIVAPGVNIMSTAVGGGYVQKTGTSMAAPFVTGSAALLMEWGIVRGNDAFMYGEKVKAYLIRGAVPLAGEAVPSERTGWGKLCVEESIPRGVV